MPLLIPDLSILFRMTSAFVLVNCHFPFDTKIMDELSMMPHVSAVHRTEGRYDLILKITAESEEKLREAISRDINKIPGVDATILLTISKKII
jgi:DNA-binding Lrp family transcriptional regulator